MTNPFLDAALEYAARGWPVFPLAPRSKEPMKGSHGHLDATTEEATIRAWWAKTPDANVGIATGAVSGIAVLDVDPRNGGDASLAKLNGHLPKTKTAKTGGGGRHFIFKYPGYFVKCSDSEIAPGLDVKADGGYIVAPPSIHPGGVPYAWDGDAPLADWPTDLVREQPGEKHDWQKTFATKIPEGSRDATLTAYAAKLGGDGLPAAVIEAALVALNATCCDPPLDLRKLHARRKAESATAKFGKPLQVVEPPSVMKFLSAAEIFASSPEGVPWIAEPLIAKGALTFLEAKPKCGKSTLLLAAVRAMIRGEEFLGRRCERTPVVYFSEQGVFGSRLALDRAGIGPEDKNLHVLTLAEAGRTSWEKVCDQAVTLALKIGAALIVDTLAPFARVADENDSATAMRAVAPLVEAASSGLPIGCARHERKSGGETGDAGRGSNAYTGACDTVVSLRRPKNAASPTLRELSFLSRLPLPFESLLIDFDGRDFVLADPERAERIADPFLVERARKILARFPDIHADDFSKKLKIRRESGGRLLKQIKTLENSEF